MAPRIIHNPVSGERIEFLRADAELLEFELQLTPDGKVPGMHVHPEQEERFHVLEGTMQFRLGLRKIVAGPGRGVRLGTNLLARGLPGWRRPDAGNH